MENVRGVEEEIRFLLRRIRQRDKARDERMGKAC